MQWVLKKQVNTEFSGMTVRELLAKGWLLPRKFIHFLRINKNITFNGKYRNMNEQVHAGEQVIMKFEGQEFRTKTSNYLVDDGYKVDVLYENDDLLVVNKPAGIKSHPNQPLEKGTLMNYVAAYLKDKDAQPYMVHRLDMQTSGAMIIAKNPVVVPILDLLISQGIIKREYLAKVSGHLPKSKGKIDFAIGKDPTDKRKRKIDGPQAKSALTYYEVLEFDDKTSLVALKLRTGRTHQLRVHLQGMGTPIIGDPLYNHDDNEQMLLHGAKQRLVIPFTNEHLVIEAPLPQYFSSN